MEIKVNCNLINNQSLYHVYIDNTEHYVDDVIIEIPTYTDKFERDGKIHHYICCQSKNIQWVKNTLVVN